jgi:hypothetical protein
MLTATTLKATGVVGILCLVLSVATVWLVVTDPVSVATAVNSGDLSSVFSALARAFAEAFRAVLRYL